MARTEGTRAAASSAANTTSACSPSGSATDAPPWGRGTAVCVGAPRMIIIRSSYDPTSATAGHAATAAPTAPARALGRVTAPSQHHHRTRTDQPVHRQGDQAPGPAGLAVRPYQRIRVLVRHHRRDSSDAEHSQRRRPPDNPICRIHRTPTSSSGNSVVSSHGLFGAVPLGHIYTRLTCDYSSLCTLMWTNRSSQLRGSNPPRTHAYVHEPGPAAGPGRHIALDLGRDIPSRVRHWAKTAELPPGGDRQHQPGSWTSSSDSRSRAPQPAALPPAPAHRERAR
jgi:hypothetical protein